jgi:hypothetical protein
MAKAKTRIEKPAIIFLIVTADLNFKPTRMQITDFRAKEASGSDGNFYKSWQSMA